MPVVYLLTNKVSNNQLVGISSSSNKLDIIDKACHHNKQIKKDITDIGIDNFSIKIISESNDTNELNSIRRKEMAAIENSYHGGKTIQKSITLSSDTVDMINYYMENKDCSFSKAIDDLVGIGGLFFLSNQYNA
jgi:hypothetical protein